MYECTIAGTAIQYTVWKGSALDCRNGISLSHGEFLQFGHESDTCNNGAILGRIINITNNCSTSQLTINITLNLNGESITCKYDNGAVEQPVHTDTIRITTGQFVTIVNVQMYTIMYLP